MSQPSYDVIVFGATSFVGQILCRYLLERYPPGSTDLRWAMAGRSNAKLQAVREALGAAASGVALVVADADDEAGLRALCDQTAVVVSTVGPYALYGETLVKVCAETGTDYCDLTGEAQWIERMLSRYEAQAQQTGARIVHCCGFDSIPSDMGVFYLQQRAHERWGAYCPRVKMRVKGVRGQFSGGTVASLINVFKEVTEDPALRKKLQNPYLLCPAGHGFTARQPDVLFAAHDPDFQSWLAPFIMAGINTRIVHRSNALLQPAYGADFQYDEAMMIGPGLKGRMAATGMATGMGLFLGAVAVKPTRWLLERYVVPKPGEGPTPRQQEAGFYDLRFLGISAQGERLQVKVTGDRDPGYGSTAKMLGEAAACLARDNLQAQRQGGFWTTASLMGEHLIERLTAHAGLTFSEV